MPTLVCVLSRWMSNCVIIHCLTLVFGSSLYHVLSGLLYRRYLATLLCTWQLYPAHLTTFIVRTWLLYVLYLATLSLHLFGVYVFKLFAVSGVMGFWGVVGLGRQGQNMGQLGLFGSWSLDHFLAPEKS